MHVITTAYRVASLQQSHGYLPPMFAVMILLYTVANEFNVAAWYTLSRDGFFAVGLNAEDAHQV